MTLETYVLIVAIFAIAGAVKGLAGIGLPTVAISLQSQFIDPRLAIILTLGPLLGSNLWQVWRMGRVLETLRRYAILGVSLGIGLFISGQFAYSVSTRTLILVLGVTVVLFSLISLFYKPPTLAAKHDKPAQFIAGAIGGLMGGMTAIWGPPILIYLIASRVEKDDFVRAIGVLLTLGAFPLIASYALAGAFDLPNITTSLTLIFPAVLGFAIGEYFRAFINPARFQRMVLWIFLLLGANLIRRAIM